MTEFYTAQYSTVTELQIIEFPVAGISYLILMLLPTTLSSVLGGS